MTSLEKKSKPSFVIQGLGGKRTLKGTIRINGAKNAALKAMAAAVLFGGPVELQNIPDNADIGTMGEVLRRLGADVKVQSSNDKDESHGLTLTIDSTTINSTDIDQELAGGMRASVVLTGPLLARYGKVSFPAPGGCVIGARPIDLFLSAYEQLGATVEETECLYNIQGKKLSPKEITFKKISVGATETLMMAAVLLDGQTILNNCAKEPEIVNVAEWLNACGASIKGAGTSTIVIDGTNGRLLSPKVPFVTIPDRIEAGSFILLAALTAEDVAIENCEPKHLGTLLDLLQGSGVNMEIGSTSIRVINDPKSPTPFKSFNIETREYPGFPTDIQAPAVVFLTQAEGTSKVTETIFEGRFKYIEDLIVLGANITPVSPQEISVTGPCDLKQSTDSRELTTHDIRAGFAVVLAALIGEGKFVVNNVHLIDRGYEKLEERLRGLGADIVRV
ncbi:MAG: UDP-N-acetylglucosamine 1-carboxyvinyltransferase [Candidatus Pacebacteria bacterium]|nr:UDP-N-acetylglucosamine 1-carboxyvinyltransferase [Candidatus Paceibacterota bacterium]